MLDFREELEEFKLVKLHDVFTAVRKERLTDSARISERTSSRRPSTSSYQFAAEDDDGGDALLRSLYDDGDAALPSDGG